MIRIFLAWLLLALPVAAQELPALHDVTGVAASDVLNIRAEPSAGADILATLPPDAQGVEVVGLSADGAWGRVNSAEISGWVAMRYLARIDTPGWISLDAPMKCYGTEPFWSLEYNPAEQNMWLDVMGEQGKLGLWMDWHVATQGRNNQIGWHLQGPARQGFATLTAESCSDGMSDRQMGLSISLFLNPAQESAATPLGLSGCCTLAK